MKYEGQITGRGALAVSVLLCYTTVVTGCRAKHEQMIAQGSLKMMEGDYKSVREDFLYEAMERERNGGCCGMFACCSSCCESSTTEQPEDERRGALKAGSEDDQVKQGSLKIVSLDEKKSKQKDGLPLRIVPPPVSPEYSKKKEKTNTTTLSTPQATLQVEDSYQCGSPEGDSSDAGSVTSTGSGGETVKVVKSGMSNLYSKYG